MSHAAELAKRHQSELRGIGRGLPDLFVEAAAALEERLGEEDLREWARISLDLAHRSPPAAASFIEATPAALAHLEPEELETWVDQGRRLHRGGWKSAQLAAHFFRVGPRLLESLSLRALDRLVEVVDQLARRSDQMASVCLRDSPSLFARLDENDREPFLAFAQAVCRTSWVDVHRCFERGPDLLRAVHSQQRGGLLDLATAAARDVRRDGFSLFAAAAEALGSLEPEDQGEVIAFAQRLAPHSSRAAIESIASAPEVRRRLSCEEARRWAEAGLALLSRGRSAERAESYFRMESATAGETLAELAARVELASVCGILRLYAKALSGEQLLVEPTAVLVGRKIGWTAEGATTTDGISIFLPAEIGLLGDQDANFQVYKVHTTHQVGRLEFGSFRYRFGVDGEHLSSTALARERRRLEAETGGEGRSRDRSAAFGASSSTAATQMQRLFDLFGDRTLISELFALAEDARIDAQTSAEYPGIRRWLCRIRDLEAERRPDVRLLALRQAFVENLLRASLGRPDLIHWPEGLRARLERAVAILRVMERTGATVQDAAEAAALLYDLAITIPNLPPHLVATRWSDLDEGAIAKASPPIGTGLHTGEKAPHGEEIPYESPIRPEYRGDFKPELVQLLDELMNQEGGEGREAPLTREQILELIEGSAEIERVDGLDDRPGDMDALLANIEREAALRAGDDDETVGPGAGDESNEEIEWFRYDEWDFRADDYRPSWCRVGERIAAEGELVFYDETLRRHHGLVVEIRRQFEQLRPEWFRRLKRLEDGHEIDLDQAIEFRADKRAGAGPLARFYTRRNKTDRDVAVALLLDMSGSTSEAILLSPGSLLEPDRSSFGRPSRRSAKGEKRIIDVERESTVLMVEALEAIGDTYGIYGFSGHGRENVEFYVIKDLDELLDDSVRRRVDKIEPIRSTRMGPAIRHAVAKLNDHEAKVKILILVSDGRPEDEEYGCDRSEKEYAVHDTKRALLEAKRQRIAPFLITVDAAGHDYLRHMCDDMGYEIVADIESLPQRLPNLYRHLAFE
jgi:nitric oxide reductase NorD protein